MPNAKTLISAPLSAWLRATAPMRRNLTRISAYAHLASSIAHPVPASVVILGRAQVYGNGQIRLGQHLLLYPDLYIETLGSGSITIGNGVVISTGTHLVAMAAITIGEGSMIGEYTSIRDANHVRRPGTPIRDSGHEAASIRIGKEVWIGRGVTILEGISIGDYATVGANAVVTRDVPAGATVGGVPARALLRSNATQPSEERTP